MDLFELFVAFLTNILAAPLLRSMPALPFSSSLVLILSSLPMIFSGLLPVASAIVLKSLLLMPFSPATAFYLT
jgi:hypothetical protein